MILQIASNILLSLVAAYIGWLFTESNRFALAKHFPSMDKKPFNCRPCLSFHLAWMLAAIGTVFTKSIPFLFTGIVCAFTLFGILYIRNKSKIEK